MYLHHTHSQARQVRANWISSHPPCLTPQEPTVPMDCQRSNTPSPIALRPSVCSERTPHGLLERPPEEPRTPSGPKSHRSNGNTTKKESAVPELHSEAGAIANGAALPPLPIPNPAGLRMAQQDQREISRVAARALHCSVHVTTCVNSGEERGTQLDSGDQRLSSALEDSAKGSVVICVCVRVPACPRACVRASVRASERAYATTGAPET